MVESSMVHNERDLVYTRDSQVKRPNRTLSSLICEYLWRCKCQTAE